MYHHTVQPHPQQFSQLGQRVVGPGDVVGPGGMHHVQHGGPPTPPGPSPARGRNVYANGHMRGQSPATQSPHRAPKLARGLSPRAGVNVPLEMRAQEHAGRPGPRRSPARPQPQLVDYQDLGSSYNSNYSDSGSQGSGSDCGSGRRANSHSPSGSGRSTPPHSHPGPQPHPNAPPGHSTSDPNIGTLAQAAQGLSAPEMTMAAAPPGAQPIVTAYPEAQRKKKSKEGFLSKMCRRGSSHNMSGAGIIPPPKPTPMPDPPQFSPGAPDSRGQSGSPSRPVPTPIQTPAAILAQQSPQSQQEQSPTMHSAGPPGQVVPAQIHDPNATLSPEMFGIIVEGCQPIVDHTISSDKYTFTIPNGLSSTERPFYVCTYLSDSYRMLPYSYVDIYASLQGEWSKMGRLDPKQTSIFMTFPALPDGHEGKVGLVIKGPLPRELKSTRAPPSRWSE